MRVVFVCLLLVHVVYSVVTRRRDEQGSREKTGGWRGRLPGIVTQTPAFLLALYFSFRAGAYTRDLMSPLAIGAGLAAGHIIFGLSLWMTYRCFTDVARHFLDFGPIWSFAVDNPTILMRFVWVSVAEEIIWRVTAQPIVVAWFAGLAQGWGGPAASGLGGSVVSASALAGGILLVAVAFSLVHKHFFRNQFWVSFEFIIFAVVLGAAYHFTESLIFVVVVHAVRNLEIAYLDYLIKLEQLGDKDEAIRAIERDCAIHPQAQTRT